MYYNTVKKKRKKKEMMTLQDAFKRSVGRISRRK